MFALKITLLILLVLPLLVLVFIFARMLGQEYSRVEKENREAQKAESRERARREVEAYKNAASHEHYRSGKH